MRHLNLGDLLLVLRNLSTERKDDLLLSGTGIVYAKMLAKQQAQIEALPEAMRGGRPLAQQLGDKDDEHDGYGEAIYYLTEALLRLPTAPAALKEAAQAVRDAFVPRLSTLRASYADEAAAASRKRHALDTRNAELQSIRVPFPVGATLYDWASSFVEAGEGLDKLLHNRSLVGNDGLSAPAIKVRAVTLGLLSRFRAALVDEIEADPALPRDLEARVFGYLDDLQAMREQAAAARAKKPEPAAGEG
ncbi:hypothetical protein [Polyangium sorediatum]|uniref:Uncharacterized protein n=1 Tax=Polyangium sorediatum TaxID=889274 RepID=A0ABT6P073_9BACT|nr:hypothetical protein [Polyangium sorediatum]MDI1434002.1 hypothetical protein [Polyangium sorediatum]